VLKRANGQYTYAAADAAYLLNKINRGFNHLIMILGQDHHSYVVRLKALTQAFGYNPDMLDIILYQLVTIKESGETLRLSKRAGRMVTLQDVIETVGVDVARFFYLNKKADAHLDFDLDLALKHSEENPVYYVQYAYVRIRSILAKAQEIKDLQVICDADAQGVGHEEAELLKKIISLKQLLINISRNYQTHLLTYYVIELAGSFHRYYSKHRVIDQENVKQSRGRLLMMQILKETFELCLTLLGLQKPETM
jgi:arginyl-tRNA synthetase